MVILDIIGQKGNDLCHCGPLMTPVSHQFSQLWPPLRGRKILPIDLVAGRTKGLNTSQSVNIVSSNLCSFADNPVIQVSDINSLLVQSICVTQNI